MIADIRNYICYMYVKECFYEKRWCNQTPAKGTRKLNKRKRKHHI